MWATVKQLKDVGMLILRDTYTEILHLDDANITLLLDENLNRAIF